MSDGFGAGFFALTVLAVLAGLAALLGLTAVAVLALRRRTGRVPAALRFLAVAALAAVVGVAGFGVLVLSDEAAVAAALLVLTVFVPLAVAGGRMARTTGLRPLDLFAATAMAWSLPFVVGAAAFVGVNAVVGAAPGLAPAGAGRLAVAWLAAAVGGLAAVAGTLVLGGRVARLLAPATAD